MSIELTPEQLQAVVDVIGKQVSTTNERGTPLAHAEYELDSALLEFENRETIEVRPHADA